MSLADLLTQHKFLALTPNNRVKCSYTGHEMPPDVTTVTQYLTSAKLQKAREWYCHDYSKYEPDIVQHQDNQKLLYCTITKQNLNKIPREVEKHVNGKHFKRLKRESLKKKKKGLKETKEKPEFWAMKQMPEDEEGEEGANVESDLEEVGSEEKGDETEAMGDGSDLSDLMPEEDDDDAAQEALVKQLLKRKSKEKESGEISRKVSTNKAERKVKSNNSGSTRGNADDNKKILSKKSRSAEVETGKRKSSVVQHEKQGKKRKISVSNSKQKT